MTRQHQLPAQYRPSTWLRVLDIVLAVMILPVIIAAIMAAFAAWRIYHPRRRRPRQRPEDLGLTAERVTVRGAGDLALSAWFLPAAGARDTVVVVHGISRNRDSVLPHARMIHDAGYNVFAFDMRNHGESGTDRSVRNHAARYTLDFLRVVAYLRERADLAGGQLAFLCFSFSTWTAMNMARFESSHVRAVVCDSGPALDIPAAFDRLIDARRELLPPVFRGPLLYRVAKAVFVGLANWFLTPTAWPPEISDRRVRLSFIAAGADPVIPPSEVQHFADRFPWSSLWIATGAAHMQPFHAHPEEYTRRVRALLEDAFERSAAALAERRL